MIYFGSYKVTDYKNIDSIPDIKKQEITKNNGVVFVISDTLFTNNNNEISQDFFMAAKKLMEKLGRQVRVFNNVEAIVLNGNIFRGLYSRNNSQILDTTMWSCSFLRALYMNASIVRSGEKPVPIYYVRGNEDCYISMQNLTSDLRGVINICNAAVIGKTIFLHGHNNLPFKECLDSDFIPSESKTIVMQEKEANTIYDQTGYNVVMSNSALKTYSGEHFISVGCFNKYRETVVDLTKWRAASPPAFR